jgi:RHS repeat-associated protein
LQDAAPTINATGACTSGHTLVQNTYDVSAPGISWPGTDYPIGRLTQSVATTYYPLSTSASVTQSSEYDQRGHVITGQLQLSLPSSWNITTALPTYQIALGYNDANQLTTTVTSTLNPTGSGLTTSQVYDSTTGIQTGLSKNLTALPNLASLYFNSNALVSDLTVGTSTDTSTPTLAKEHFTYDGDLRPVEATATWQSGSGSSGQIFDQSRWYDAASNLVSLSTTQAAVPGQSGSGGSETQNFCYTEQSQLVWAGNSGSQPAAGNGTCGSQALSSGLSGASYATSYAYTHLGQLWQAPLAGSGATAQYLYCAAGAHQLDGLYPPGTTCATKSGAFYKSSYDAFGNVTTRTTGGSTATLSYDALDHLSKWNLGANSEHYLYDASGNRVLRRSINGGTTTITTYPFGAEEHTYSGTGTLQSNTYYYSLGGRLIGELTGSPTPLNTSIFLTDALGSVLATFSNTAGSAALLGNQVYGPYGTQRYTKGSMGTNKGFTGQYNDSLTGLDYYNARYYDPTAAVFLSVDIKQGNLQGMNPYDYVGGNPETWSDPTGQRVACPDPSGCNGSGSGSTGNGNSGGPSPTKSNFVVGDYPVSTATDAPPVELPVEVGVGTGVVAACVASVVCMLAVAVVGAFCLILCFPSTLSEGPLQHYPVYLGPLTGVDTPDVTTSVINIVAHTNPPQTQPGGSGGSPPGGGPRPTAGSGFCSFTPDTQVTTDHGKQSIGALHVGEKVEAYNPKTHKMEMQPILHVWTHKDNDLVDLTITTTTTSQHGKPVTLKHEVVHTTSEHPFLTTEKGFEPAGKIQMGIHILKADGSVGVITGWRNVHGTKVMYNLEVAQDHTFTVGDGQWVVHNSCDPDKLRRNMSNSGITFQTGQQAHHVIPCSVYNRGHDLLTQAGTQFDPDAAYNGRAMYTKDYSAEAMNNLEPYHANSPRYAARVRGMMDAEFQRLQSNGLTTAQDASDSLMGIIDQLNQSINDIGVLSVIFQTSCGLY